MVFDVLRREIGVKMGRSRFYVGGYGYPLDVVVFEDPRQLGFFDSSTMTLGMGKKLMYEANDGVIKNIVRHELAHCMIFVGGGDGKPHGEEFRAFCRARGWGPEVYSATVDIDRENDNYAQPSYDRLASRIKKILSLGSSPNPHEARAAVVKANQLLLRHNLSRDAVSDDGEEEAALKRVLAYPRRNAKLLCIADILETFFVKTVLNFGRGTVCLEAIGSRINVELAEYAAGFLDRRTRTPLALLQEGAPRARRHLHEDCLLRGDSGGLHGKNPLPPKPERGRGAARRRHRSTGKKGRPRLRQTWYPRNLPPTGRAPRRRTR